MFSGPGISAFLQPIRAAGTQAAPAQAIAALPKVGDEPKNRNDSPAEKETPSPDTAARADAEDMRTADAFAEDHTELSIDALRQLLTGKSADTGTPAAPPAAEQETSPEMRQAAAAYQHAKDAQPAAGLAPNAAGFNPPPRDRATAADILLMLAEIEAAGIHRIAVRDGASIYDTLAALCWSLQR